MVGQDGVLPLPWLAATLHHTLLTRHAHALLLHGPRGVGQFELALTLAQAWLCEAATASATAGASSARATMDATTDATTEATTRATTEASAPPRPCGRCAACRLVQARSHPDLLVLLPEALREPLGWNLNDAADTASEKASKAKPSKEIKVEAVRSAVAFAQITSARGRCKVVVVYPAERMNEVAANTLLKTLEEPPGVARFLLACAEPEALLATIRSRCQAVPMRLPPTDLAVQWLAQQGVVDPGVLLAAAGGQPQEAREWAGQGIDAALWSRLPALVLRGEATPLAAWPLARVVDALQKLCHDASCRAAGAAPRYFALTAMASLPPAADPIALADWSRDLLRAARHAEHPWNAGLMVEALVQRGQRALAGSGPAVSDRTVSAQPALAQPASAHPASVNSRR